MSADGGPGNREVAYRLFAAEFEDSTVSYSESDEERAPNYVITPTGGRVNRLFLAGVLTETERVGGEQLRGRVVDPTGAFVAYAGQYQPDELAFLDRVEPPAFLAVTGKARTFSPEDSDRVYTSVRPESISEVDAETRDRWVVRTAEQTLDRVATMASALRSDLRGEGLRERLVEEGVDPGLASGVALAIEHYGPSSAYLQALRETALDAVRVVAGERDEVDRLDLAPDEGGTDDAVLAGLAGPDLGTGTPDAGIAAGEPATEEPDAGKSSARADAGSEAGASDPTAPTEPGEGTAATGAGGEPSSEPEPEPGTGTEPAETTAESVDTTAESAEATAGSDTEPGTATATASESETEPSTSGAEAETEAETEPLEAGAETDTAEPTPSAGETSEPVGADEELEDFEPGEFELPEEEREEIEAEFGTDFETAGEVEPAGEAGIETPEPDAGADEDDSGGAAAEPDPAGTVDTVQGTSEPETTEPEASDSATAEGSSEEPSAGTGSEPEPETGTGSDEEGAEAGVETGAGGETESDLDVDEATVEAIAELDDGDGADREAVVETVAERHGFDPEEVDDAIEDAMMSGRAYEPSDGRLKTI